VSWSEEKTLEKYISEQNSTVQSAITNAINTQTSTIKGYTDAISNVLSTGRVSELAAFWSDLVNRVDRNYNYVGSSKWPFSSITYNSTIILYPASSSASPNTSTITGKGVAFIYYERSTDSNGTFGISIDGSNYGSDVAIWMVDHDVYTSMYRIPFNTSLILRNDTSATDTWYCVKLHVAVAFV
jgi:hypothetical protein